MNYHVIDISKTPRSIIPGQLLMGGTNPKGDRININHYYLEMNGKPYLPISGEFHFSRYPCLNWETEIIKMKLAGINLIPTYVFWIYHEEEEGRFDWDGNNNLRYFVALCAQHQVNVILRIGPFAHGECRNGGLPDWLYGKPFEVRSNDPGYLFYVKRFYQEIGRQVTGALFKEGGPVVGIQLENEFTASSAKWEPTILQGDEWIPTGSGGVEHLRILKQLALEAGLEVPLYTCTAWGQAPVLANEVLPMWGGYAFQPWLLYWNPQITAHPPTDNYIFRDYHQNSVNYLDASYPVEQYPFACCEIGGGMQTWYNCRFVAPPESVEALVVNRVGGGCNFVGYYMFHGGSHPVGKHSYLNERCVPKISYDFQAPLGEFGQINAAYRYLKLLHLFLEDFQEILCPMVTVLPEGAEQIQPVDLETLRYAARVKGDSGFLFLTNYQDHLTTKDHHDLRFVLNLPAEKLTVPADAGITLKSNVSAILPFNLQLDGIRLKYATAQLITRITVAEAVYYFCFAPEGMASEFCFDASTCRGVRTKTGPVAEREQRYFVAIEPGSDNVITISSGAGKKIHIVTLTRQQALGLWKIDLWGQERIVLTEAEIISAGDYLKLRRTGEPVCDLMIFPKVAGAYLYGNDQLMPDDSEGLFSHYTLQFPQKALDWNWRMISPGKAVIKIVPEAFDGVAELFLRIEYTGDVGSAYIGGQLIHDHFCNGAPWEIGLKRFYPDITAKEFYLSISPARQGEVVYHDAALGIKANFQGAEIKEIHSIDLIPQYQIVVTAQGFD
jgi:hypothetical protein